MRGFGCSGCCYLPPGDRPAHLLSLPQHTWVLLCSSLLRSLLIHTLAVVTREPLRPVTLWVKKPVTFLSRSAHVTLLFCSAHQLFAFTDRMPEQTCLGAKLPIKRVEHERKPFPRQLTLDSRFDGKGRGGKGQRFASHNAIET